MIQRIQSVFLLLAGAASFGLFGLPFAKTPEAIEGSVIFNDAVYNLNDQIGLAVLFGLAGLMAVIGIFLFRNRPLQLKVSLSALILNLGGLVFGIFYLRQNISEQAAKVIKDGLGMYLPVAALLFIFLAYRFIKRDEKLVKSMDRLR